MTKTLNIEVEEILDNIYHLCFDSRLDVASSLIRFQEYYEHPTFKDKIFTLKEFMNESGYIPAHQERSEENFFKHYDWGGFNFPSSTIQPFLEGKFDPLSAKEKQVLKILKKIKEPFYVIGTYKKTDSHDFKIRLMHEVAHGLYHTNAKYRREVQNALATTNYRLKKEIYTFLKNNSYHHDVWEDELHCYILEPEYLEHETMMLYGIKKIHHQLQKIFSKYSKNILK